MNQTADESNKQIAENKKLRIRRHVVLVGLMGSGKSSVGRRLAQQLGRTFVDTDRLVEHDAHSTVREIFETSGEEEFRRLESAALRAAVESPVPSVIAAAGGVVLSETNRRILAEGTRANDLVVVWLDTSTTELAGRVKRGAHRPLLDHDPQGTLDRMANDRRALYEEVSSIVIDTDGRSIEQVATELTELLGQNGVRNV